MDEHLDAARRPLRCSTEFHVDHKIGAGTFGEVFAVVNRVDHREYAVKRVRMLRDRSDAPRDWIMREVAALSDLHHRNVVRYYNAWIEPAAKDWPRWSGGQGSDSSSDSDGSSEAERQAQRLEDFSSSQFLYIQMELVESTLREYIDSTSELSVSSHGDLWDLFGQLLTGMGYLHTMGFVHRDLKPSNLLLATAAFDGSLHVKIGDLGLARQAVQPTGPAAPVAENPSAPLEDSLRSSVLSRVAVGVTVRRRAPSQIPPKESALRSMPPQRRSRVCSMRLQMCSVLGWSYSKCSSGSVLWQLV
eukprot:TRINITY_DN10249_c0_g2_i1.p1 TRINITY_DN10249_c0_g2~~TRINITY_DN10249_c0_g2_i1.p1  ORF type:complete len:303 (-),score=32.91 TRINITY_DN10249_c0_g2_i1:569-1477(-)